MDSRLAAELRVCWVGDFVTCSQYCAACLLTSYNVMFRVPSAFRFNMCDMRPEIKNQVDCCFSNSFCSDYVASDVSCAVQ